MAKVKIPKRVAGVKIPKKVRRKAKKAVKLVKGPAVREFAAAALGAAAQAKADRTAGNGYRVGGQPLAIDADRLARVVRTAALDGLRRFMEGFDEGMRRATAESDAGAAPPPGAGRDADGGP